MADMDPEMAAFLEQEKQREYDPAADYGSAAAPPAADDDDEYDPASAFANPVHSPSVHEASAPASAHNTPPPAPEGALKPQPVDAAAAPAPSKQPRTKGGFVDESEDDEDEVPVAKPKSAGAALLNASGVSESPQRSVTLSPSNTLAQQQAIPSLSAHHQAVPGVPQSSVPVPATVSPAAVPNGGSAPPDATHAGIPDHLAAASARQSTAPVTPVPAPLPKARLPQDKVGILEDRIAEDPRGDIEAWLSLIEEHRKRHKYDDARAVFERFFKIFPSAVSIFDQM